MKQTFIISHRTAPALPGSVPQTLDHPVPAENAEEAIALFRGIVQGGEILQAVLASAVIGNDDVATIGEARRVLSDVLYFPYIRFPLTTRSGELKTSVESMMQKLEGVERKLMQPARPHEDPVKEIHIQLEGGVLNSVDNVPEGVRVIVCDYDVEEEEFRRLPEDRRGLNGCGERYRIDTYEGGSKA